MSLLCHIELKIKALRQSLPRRYFHIQMSFYCGRWKWPEAYETPDQHTASDRGNDMVTWTMNFDTYTTSMIWPSNGPKPSGQQERKLKSCGWSVRTFSEITYVRKVNKYHTHDTYMRVSVINWILLSVRRQLMQENTHRFVVNVM